MRTRITPVYTRPLNAVAENVVGNSHLSTHNPHLETPFSNEHENEIAIPKAALIRIPVYEHPFYFDCMTCPLSACPTGEPVFQLGNRHLKRRFCPDFAAGGGEVGAEG
jgi:hypothetical protein